MRYPDWSEVSQHRWPGCEQEALSSQTDIVPAHLIHFYQMRYKLQLLNPSYCTLNIGSIYSEHAKWGRLSSTWQRHDIRDAHLKQPLKKGCRPNGEKLFLPLSLPLPHRPPFSAASTLRHRWHHHQRLHQPVVQLQLPERGQRPEGSHLGCLGGTRVGCFCSFETAS